MDNTATTMVGIQAALSSWTTNPTISRVKPNIRRQAVTMTAPMTMRGRRRPHLDLLSSDMTPTMGWTMSPDRGPATQTRDVLLLVRPRLRRYGVQSEAYQLSNWTKEMDWWDQGRTGHFNAPCEAIHFVVSKGSLTHTYDMLG
jgi:hypothetical protein